jgi:hypothetical protein
MSSIPHISPSQMETFACRLAWGWGKKYEPVRPNIHQEFGLGIHLALEKYYKSNCKVDPVRIFTKWADARLNVDTKFDDDLAELANMRTLGITMLEGYVEHYKGKEPFKVITTEHECEIPIPTPTPECRPIKCNLHVRVDALVEDTKLEKIFVLEHKTFSSFSLDQLERDHQFVAEKWVGSKLSKKLTGRPVSGVIYNGLRKHIPSNRTKADSFERHYIFINQKRVRLMLLRAYWTWIIMNDKRIPLYPQPNNVRCRWCTFKEPCTEFQAGGDYKFLLDTNFKPRDTSKSLSEFD